MIATVRNVSRRKLLFVVCRNFCRASGELFLYEKSMRGTTQWTVVESPIETIEKFAKTLGVTSILARLLWNRGHQDEESARKFLDSRLKDLADPFLLQGMQKAVDRTLHAILKKE